MYTSTPAVKNCKTEKIYFRENEMYTPLPTTNSKIPASINGKKSEMVALFMDSCSTTSGSCVQSHLLGPSDTYSTTSSGNKIINQFHPMSDSSSFTDSSYSKWILPPYTPVDYRHYMNVPVYKPTTVQIHTVKRTSRKSVWLGLIFGFSIFLLIVLGAVIAYGLEKGMI